MGLVDDHPHQWPKPLQALEHRAFRYLWLATFVSNAGSWMQRVATAWLVYTLSASEVWLGVDAILSGLPTFLILPWSGVLADRLDRRMVLVVANVASAILSVVLAIIWWSGNLATWHLLASSFLASIISSTAAPATQSILPTAAGEDHIPNAIALNSFQYNVARAIGPAVGGLALALTGAGWCFALNALSYMLMVAGLLTVPISAHAAVRKGSTFENFGEGLRLVRQNPALKRSLLFVMILAFAGAPMVTLLPTVARLLTGGSAAEYSMLVTGFGVGAALAGALRAIYQPPRSLAWLLGSAIVIGSCHVVMPWVSMLAISVLVATITGMAFVGSMIELGIDLMAHTPDELRGRISSFQQLSFRGAQPLGGFVGALIARYAGVEVTFVGFGILLILGALAVALFYRARPS